MLSRMTTRGGLVATTAIFAGCLLVLTPQGREVLTPGPFLRGEAEPPSPQPAPDAEETRDPAPSTDRPVTGSTAGQPTDDAVTAPDPLNATRMAESEEESDLDGGMMDNMLAAPAPAVRPEIAGRSAEAAAAESDFGGLARDNAPTAEGEALPLAPDTEAFANAAPSDLKITAEAPVSTFSIDVDTASWSIVRSSLMRGELPPPAAVRIEEMINYFPYAYPAPGDGAPFRAELGVIETPWNAGTRLVRIGLQGELPELDARPPLNLVFLIDTSGSMDAADKLPLLRQSFRLMLSELRPEDEVAIVAYAGSAGRVLDPTPAGDRQAILDALDRLSAGGSTNGQGGLQQAYAVAEGMADEGEVSRILLATDGDFNVGLSDPSALTDYVGEKRRTGTYLSVLGFGRGNLDDATMQALAQNGNGTAAYIDTLNEAQKVLVDQLSGALFPIADDVKIQVEFNPATVAEYRLIGYETRALRREDFNNDAVDAGELGAGHSVTALYEITPVGSDARLTDPLRYAPAEAKGTDASDEYGFLRLRYKVPGEDESRLIETPIPSELSADENASFAAAIAGFGELLRGSDYLGDWSYAAAIELAGANQGADTFGYRSEAVRLMRLAQSLSQ
ncbi:vWA domain-containing protein [Roseisalinus antarcticus]